MVVHAENKNLAEAFSKHSRFGGLRAATIVGRHQLGMPFSLWANEDGNSLTDICYPDLPYDRIASCEEDDDVPPPMPPPWDPEDTGPQMFPATACFRVNQRRMKRPGALPQFLRMETGATQKCVLGHTGTEYFPEFNQTHYSEENMDRMIEPNTKSFIPVDIGKSYLNEVIAYFQSLFGHLPLEYYAIDFDRFDKTLNLEKSMASVESAFGIQHRFVFRSTDFKNRKIKISEVNYVLDDGLLLFLSSLFNAAIAVYDRPESLDKLLPHIISTKHRKQKEKPKFKLLVHNSYGFSTDEFELKSFSIDLDANYNNDLPDAKIKHFIEADGEAGLCILHGKPGTGKTYYIRHLIKNSRRDFIYMNKECLNYINDSSFISFLTKSKNSVFIMEDCENVLVDRTQYNNTISTLLNLSDGLLGDSLNNKFICTFNTDIANIDEALLRKGRMKVCYEFKYLEPDKANALARKLGKPEGFDKAMPLCDIMNSESNGNEDIPSKKHRKIGF